MKIALTAGDPKGIGTDILNIICQNNYLDKYKNICEFEFFTPESLNTLNSHDDISFQCLEHAVTSCLENQCQALVTGPINKAKWQLHGHTYAGQTEYLNYRCQANGEMLFIANDWKVLLITRHIPLKDVSQAITYERLQKLTQDIYKFENNNSNITIAMASLNPHAGEDGNIGLEEIQFYNDWCKELNITGPLSPDNIWTNSAQAYLKQIPQQYNYYLAPYHDQVLPLIKAITNLKAVNTTINLPFIRTSPDHGTAYDLVGTGKADIQPYLHAIDTAVKLTLEKN